MRTNLPGPMNYTEAFRWLRAQRSRAVWGSWKYHPNNFTLECRDERGFIYEVDLERCRTSAEMLDWIFQVNKKTWATAEIVKNLLDAFECLLSPQATLCSFGVSTSMNPREVLSGRTTPNDEKTP